MNDIHTTRLVILLMFLSNVYSFGQDTGCNDYSYCGRRIVRLVFSDSLEDTYYGTPEKSELYCGAFLTLYKNGRFALAFNNLGDAVFTAGYYTLQQGGVILNTAADSFFELFDSYIYEDYKSVVIDRVHRPFGAKWGYIFCELENYKVLFKKNNKRLNLGCLDYYGTCMRLFGSNSYCIGQNISTRVDSGYELTILNPEEAVLRSFDEGYLYYDTLFSYVHYSTKEYEILMVGFYPLVEADGNYVAKGKLIARPDMGAGRHYLTIRRYGNCDPEAVIREFDCIEIVPDP